MGAMREPVVRPYAWIREHFCNFLYFEDDSLRSGEKLLDEEMFEIRRVSPEGVSAAASVVVGGSSVPVDGAAVPGVNPWTEGYRYLCSVLPEHWTKAARVFGPWPRIIDLVGINLEWLVSDDDRGAVRCVSGVDEAHVWPDAHAHASSGCENMLVRGCSDAKVRVRDVHDKEKVVDSVTHRRGGVGVFDVDTGDPLLTGDDVVFVQHKIDFPNRGTDRGVACSCGVRDELSTKLGAFGEVYSGGVLVSWNIQELSEGLCSYGVIDALGFHALRFHGGGGNLHFQVAAVGMLYLPANAKYRLGSVTVEVGADVLRVLVMDRLQVQLLEGNVAAVVLRVGTYRDKQNWLQKYAKVNLDGMEIRAWLQVGGDLAAMGFVDCDSPDDPLSLSASGPCDDFGFVECEVAGRGNYVVAQFGTSVRVVSGKVYVNFGQLSVSLDFDQSLFVGPTVRECSIECVGGCATLSGAEDEFALADGIEDDEGFMTM